MSELSESLRKCRVEGNVVHLPSLSDGVLPNYVQVREALMGAGAKYRSNMFVFESEAQPIVDAICGEGS